MLSYYWTRAYNIKPFTCNMHASYTTACLRAFSAQISLKRSHDSEWVKSKTYFAFVERDTIFNDTITIYLSHLVLNILFTKHTTISLSPPRNPQFGTCHAVAKTFMATENTLVGILFFIKNNDSRRWLINNRVILKPPYNIIATLWLGHEFAKRYK